MNETISRWLRSGLMPEFVALTAASLLLSLLGILKRRKKSGNRLVQPVPKELTGDSPTEELPVAEVRVAMRTFRVLEDIVFCESEFIIS